MRYSLGIDIGGTNVKAACISEHGTLIEWRTAETGGDSAWREGVRAFVDTLQKDLATPAMCIGVAAPGLAARDGRSIEFMPARLQGLERLDWTQFLSAPAAVPVLNDAHAALLGEAAFGAAAGLQDVFMLTLGTGVGGAFMLGGKVARGHIGRAGHMGHISLNVDGAPDIVGMPGSLEDAIGECTLPARSNGVYASTQKLVADYLRGIPIARALWLRSVQALAVSIAGLINVLDPEAVIVGGGIANAGKALFEPLNEYLAKCEWRPAGQLAKILPAKLGEKAGALGAAHAAAARGSDVAREFFDY
jgi:glucokinase